MWLINRLCNKMQLSPKEPANSRIDMDSKDGLFVPVIKKAQTLSTDELHDQLNELKVDVSQST